MLREKVTKIAAKKDTDVGTLLLRVLDWVVDEQLAGNSPNDFDVAKHFDISVDEAIDIHDYLEEIGEFD